MSATFIDRLASGLDLVVGSATLSIEPRQIEGFSVEVRPWGFTATMTFAVICRSSPDEDTVFEPFLKPDLTRATLKLGRTFDEVGETAQAMVLKGVVVEKSVEERDVGEVAGAPVLRRRYTVRVVDQAQAFWSQHRPTLLLVDTTYQALLAANLPQGFTLSHDWTASTRQRPVLALGLGVDESAAHFFDFVCWLADREGVGLFHDPTAGTSKISGTKPAVTGPTALEPGEVGTVEVRFPPLRRAKVAVLNSYTDASERRKEGDNELAVEGVKAEYLVRSPIATDLDNRSTLEGTRAQQPLPRARLALRLFPAAPPIINQGLSLGDGFSANLYTHGKSFRVTGIDITGTAVGEEGGVDAEAGRRYELTYGLDVEQATDPVMHLPRYTRPTWPFHVEGKVVSEIGEDVEETYQIYQDSATSQDIYKVAVPLFEDKKVIVLFEPMTLSGHLYFPAYKGERVLLALDFDRANFAGFLDWRPGARLPLDSQGNHILMGKQASSQTSVRHVYEDAKPVLAIKRTSDKDEQTIVIKEGTITLTTLEND